MEEPVTRGDAPQPAFVAFKTAGGGANAYAVGALVDALDSVKKWCVARIVQLEATRAYGTHVI